MAFKTEFVSPLHVKAKMPDTALPDFQRCYEDHASLVRSLLYRLCGATDLDDLVQEVFVKVWKGLSGFRGQASVKTWVYRIAYYHALDYMRKKRPLMSALDESIPEAVATEQKISNQDLIQRGLSTLGPDHRAVLVLHCIEGLSIEEIGNVLEVPTGTVKSRIHFARKNIQAFLESSGVKL